MQMVTKTLLTSVSSVEQMVCLVKTLMTGQMIQMELHVMEVSVYAALESAYNLEYPKITHNYFKRFQKYIPLLYDNTFILLWVIRGAN